MNINTEQLNLSIYHHSYERYMSSFKLSRKVYWGRKHILMAVALGKDNLIHSAG